MRKLILTIFCLSLLGCANEFDVDFVTSIYGIEIDLDGITPNLEKLDVYIDTAEAELQARGYFIELPVTVQVTPPEATPNKAGNSWFVYKRTFITENNLVNEMIDDDMKPAMQVDWFGDEKSEFFGAWAYIHERFHNAGYKHPPHSQFRGNLEWINEVHLEIHKIASKEARKVD